MLPLPPDTDPQEFGTVIGAVIATVLATLWATLRGGKKTPVEAGSAPPPVDQAAYALTEIRALARAEDTRHADLCERLDEIEKTMTAIHTDTQVLRDRGRG